MPIRDTQSEVLLLHLVNIKLLHSFSVVCKKSNHYILEKFLVNLIL